MSEPSPQPSSSTAEDADAGAPAAPSADAAPAAQGETPEAKPDAVKPGAVPPGTMILYRSMQNEHASKAPPPPPPSSSTPGQSDKPSEPAEPLKPGALPPATAVLHRSMQGGGTAVLPPPDSPFAPAADTLNEDLYPSAKGVPPPSGIFRLTRAIAEKPPAPRPEPILVAEGLYKSFGAREVVRGVNLEVGAGEIVGLLGRNGSGKTTTFRTIMGMLRPDKGRVSFELRDITSAPMYDRANRGMGYLAQEPSVFQRLTVEENILAVMELRVGGRAEQRQRLDQLIRSFGLETVRQSQAGSLSGGERRRLEIARAMTLDPKIVLFDEPFAGIDPIAVTEIQGILRDLKGQGKGVLITDHNVRETLTITDRTYIMDEGKIWIHGSPREIVNHPEARQRYLGMGFRLDF
ncbi:MAG: hypothetical protein AMXMBFR7_38010 [Planctomycetota bacterium]